jgi:hypothetical protein
MSARRSTLQTDTESNLFYDKELDTRLILFIRFIQEFLMQSISQLPRSVYASGPTRTRPLRTYDPIEEQTASEGAHFPHMIARLKYENPSKWTALKESLEEYGQESGLFHQIDVKRLGKSDSDPFQIYIRTIGPERNIVDVGYGVSQVLPVIADLILGAGGRAHLYQQPEVHLHPKAQAAFGTFLTRVVKTARSPIILETHSDFIIDRIRLAVRDGHLKPADVNIVFFYKKGASSIAENIRVDTDGMVVDPPEEYRSFFLSEQLRRLSR